ncbi:MAG: type II secretion system protein [bacterium]|nr:type II secretion system protein [bacterium]
MITARRSGFTLIELLVVIGILAVLLAIVLIAINPARQFSQANNTKRRSDVNAILNAVHQYAADNKGTLPAGVTAVDQEITDAAANVCSDLVTQYLAALPVDPLTNNGTPITDCSAAYTTGYNIIKSAADNRLTVSAPDAELSEVINVVR